MWRAMIARHEGMTVSSSLAPPSRTDSVTHNSQVAVALEGMHWFKPLRAFDAPTAQALMTYLLVHNLSYPESVAQGKAPIANPVDLFKDLAVHGGSWRCGYTTNSVGKACFLAGKISAQPKDAPPVAGKDGGCC
eukprot:NODE_8401_length_704_cov_4.053356_g8145_i0.p1 GENE.NODE_8401_length_704_cov_4.053356_g8145_i0~~NODE_8401_length_704_cov_4.053356_g8145_i0.p1  ORF type:complete len:134 (-),score=21.20 NODE_8401_length_704_cov_4.053356_g8145_i0:150-551(-)